MDISRSDHPCVQPEPATEGVPAASEDGEALAAIVGIDRGDDASLSHRVNAEHCGTDGKCLTREPRLELGGNPGEEDVGTQPPHAHSEPLDGAIGGHHQAQDVESFGRGIGDEAGFRPRTVTYHFHGVGGLSRVTVDGRQPVRAGGRRQGEETGAGPAGEGATRAGDVDETVAPDAVRGGVRTPCSRP